jgi:Zn2+/Cd2+-exporting ATPase
VKTSGLKDVQNSAPRSIEQLAEKAAAQKPSDNGVDSSWITLEWLLAGCSFLLLIVGLILDHYAAWFNGAFRLLSYSVAFLPVGFPVIQKGVQYALRGDLFTEFFLMSLATIGAFYLGEYPEGVAVMLFYSVGELLQGAAVARAKRNIKALLDVRPALANVIRDGHVVAVGPTDVKVGEIIQVKAGERVALDGTMESEETTFNTSALTGESSPALISKGEPVLAGMINEGQVVELTVTRLFEESSLARILALVQGAQGRKAKTELFIRRFARYYTPAVVFLALAVVVVPYFFVTDYNFHQWLYRALIFLVISCPCALVVAIPLGYFGGIGAGSRNGVLFKGSAFLDRATRIGTVVFDKTGTLTKGTFKVAEIVDGELTSAQWLPLVQALEGNSNHPAAKAIRATASDISYVTKDVIEFKGQGLKGMINGNEVVAGNESLFQRLKLPYDKTVTQRPETLILCSVNSTYAGYIVVTDEIKPDAARTIADLHSLGIGSAMLSGDKDAITRRTAEELKIPVAYGGLLPEDKVSSYESIRKDKAHTVAFIGDGINDAPVLALSDLGIAMGGMGSDAAIETADVVIQTDQPSKLITAINIGRATNAIVWQNIALAFLVKFLVLGLGTAGLASMWEAVFADVGVALLAIANAIRIQYKKF